MANKTNEIENARIGRLLQYARESSKILQSDMIESTGLTKNHISAVERGVSKASVEMLLGYCEKLDKTPNDILGFADNEIIPELYSELVKMDEENQRKVLEIVRIINR